MKKVFAGALLAAVAASGTAMAACTHNGIYYEHGAVLCFDGYIQECTVADYWKAIGTCNAPDPRPQTARTPDEQTLIALTLGATRAVSPAPERR